MKAYFKNKEGLKLVGILETPEAKTKTCIILCHGATVDKEEGGIFTELSSRLVKAGFSTFRFDFRGHGESEGNSADMTISNQKQDLESVLRFLKMKGYERFGILSASFSGGAVSLFVLSHQNKIKALIYWNSVLDYKYLLKRWLSGNENKRLNEKGFVIRSKTKYGKKLIKQVSELVLDTKLKELRIPVLFVHGDKDSHVPYSDSVKYSRMLNSRLETIHGAEHGFHGNKKHANQADSASVKFFLDNLS